MNKEKDNEWALRLEEQRAERFYSHLPKFLARLMIFRHWSMNNEEIMKLVEIFFERNFKEQMEWVASQLDSDDPLTSAVACRYLADIKLALMVINREINDKDAMVDMYLSLCAGFIFMQQVIKMKNAAETAQSLACCYIVEMGRRINKIRELIYRDSWKISSKMRTKKGGKPTK